MNLHNSFRNSGEVPENGDMYTAVNFYYNEVI